MQPVPATEIELAIGDGDYLCALKLPQLAELQDKCAAGLLTIYGRMMAGRYVMGDQAVGVPHEGQAFTADVYQTIRLGLIGGGSALVDGAHVRVDALAASKVMERYIYPAPFEAAWNIAVAILSAKVVGYVPPKAGPAAAVAKRPRRGRAKTASI